ncbi:GGDEF domain-containing protein [bacterium]|nr:GGDEF domain-containing protein [candidate division CSSED10-310 bacterium]
MNARNYEDSSKTIRANSIKLDPRLDVDESAFVPQLTIIAGPRIGTSIRLSASRRHLTIGRGETEFVIAHDTVSRRHAELILQPDNEVLIRDLNSTNGLYVNGMRVLSTRLVNGDKVAIGDVILRFELLDPLDAHYQQELSRKLSGALKDPLTGLYSRKYFEDEAPRKFAALQEKRKMCSLIMIDIDFFKRINDEYGHLVGDRVLTLLGQRILMHIRAHDIACRYGGEEFIIILPNCDAATAFEVGERIRQTVESLEITDVTPPLRVTLSSGVVEMRPEETLLSLIDRADKGLYQAKNAGRNQTIYGPGLTE